MALKSALYLGEVTHLRRVPTRHRLRFPLFMVYLDLSELDRVFAGRWLWSINKPNIASFRREDFKIGPPEQPLDEAVRNLVKDKTGIDPGGPVRMLAHLRYFGHGFNPVTFFYCFAPDGIELKAIVSQITNTPWRETHIDVLPVPESLSPGEKLHFRFDKNFHVSPFMPMQMRYDWHFSRPDEAPASRLQVHMENHTLPGCDPRYGPPDTHVFDATLQLRRQTLTSKNMALALLRHPFLTVQVLAAIYFNAALLRLKKTPFVPHPQPQ